MTAQPVRLIWVTPDAEDLLTYIARVSNPSKQSEPTETLIGYLMSNDHWSPFEMVNLCFEMNTTRDIGRQFLRHWTMRPQEFSQRYQDVTLLGEPVYREARMQHPTNRQMSMPCEDQEIADWWQIAQAQVWGVIERHYKEALRRGIAKEVARAILPEGMTPSKLYFNAPLRTALHVVNIRSKKHGAQDEAVKLAQGIEEILEAEFPKTMIAFREWVKRNDA